MVLDMRKIKQSKVNFRISKTYPIFEIVYHSIIHATNLAIKAVDKIKWTVLSETKTIEKFTAKKATTYFGGRNRIAWFTNDIQIQDGLYTFCGLPGLLLTIEDDKANHQFKFVGNQKIEKEQRLRFFNERNLCYQKEIKCSMERIQKGSRKKYQINAQLVPNVGNFILQCTQWKSYVKTGFNKRKTTTCCRKY